MEAAEESEERVDPVSTILGLNFPICKRKVISRYQGHIRHLDGTPTHAVQIHTGSIFASAFIGDIGL